MFSERELQILNTLEMMVYNYVCKNREKVVYMKIRELAAETHVSTTTILHTPTMRPLIFITVIRATLP